MNTPLATAAISAGRMTWPLMPYTAMNASTGTPESIRPFQPPIACCSIARSTPTGAGSGGSGADAPRD